MKRLIFDLESDGLMDTITKIHCLCYYDFDTGESKSLVEYQDIIDLVEQDDLTLIGHNIRRFDIPAIKKILCVDIKARIIDTLPVSWYLFPEQKIHGLENWGERLGVAKPEIDDWTNLSTEEYVNRCSEDVKINTLLFNMQIQKLLKIYGDLGIDRILDYLSYKMDCAREQEEVRWRLDTEKVRIVLPKLEAEKELKRQALTNIMPDNVKLGKVSKPKKLIIKDGSVSAQGERWYYLLGQKGLPINHEEDVEVEILRERGNPASVAQLKGWLFSLGWVPQEFKYVKEEQPDGRSVNRSIPQINTQDEGLCPSVKALFEREPGLENLESLGIISHRISILKGWLEAVSEDGYIKAEIAGLTNTLRFIHKTIVNVPTIHKPYGEDLRGCLIAPEGYILCGSDVSGLEDTTKHHYMMYYDPDYVNEQRQEGYDPHLSIAVAGDMASNHEEFFFKWYKSKERRNPSEIKLPLLSAKGVTGFTFHQLVLLSSEEQKIIVDKITKVRWGAKRVNFGAVYGAGIPKLMLTSGMDKPITTTLYKGYWKKNWSVKQIAKDTFHKTVDGQMWLYNPVSKFYISLRFEKDKFSSLNQSTGVYCFDTWVSNVRERQIKLCGQFHDEIVFPLLEQDKELRKQQLLESMEEANNELNLNVRLSISVDMGDSYSSVH